MSGLGIVIEEPESVSLRGETPALEPQPSARLSSDSYGATETLLPPLPEADGNQAKSPGLRLSMPTFAPTAPSVLSPGGILSPGASLGRSSSAPSSVELLQAERFFVPPESADLDLTALNTEPSTIPFPTLESLESQTSVISPPAQAPASGSTVSPLKRLKSLKNGIRKLSLSRIASSTSLASSEAPSPKITQGPVHIDPNDDGSSSESGRSSAFAHAHTNSATNSNHTHTNSAHTHTSSQGSIIIPKTRRATVSQSYGSSTSPTPPLPQPVVVLSENLSSTRKNLASVEQTYFDNIPADSQYNSSLSSSQSSQVSQPAFSASTAALGDGNSIAMLHTPDELIEYSMYLSEHKKSVETAYDVSRERLESSGWCSGHDIENLALQKDSSLSQIDTKILQIEEKLSQEFNISILDNEGPCKCGLKDTLSPSLKDLESRCLSYSSERI